MPQNRVASPHVFGNGKGINLRILQIGNLLAMHTDYVMMGFRNGIEPDGLMQGGVNGHSCRAARALPARCTRRHGRSSDATV